jgi:hypothetical protein
LSVAPSLSNDEGLTGVLSNIMLQAKISSARKA